MGSLIRALVIWLLVLAVPAQAAAAATMTFCGPNHHGGAAAHAQPAAAPDEHAHHGGHDAASAHRHPAMAAQADENGAAAAPFAHADKQTCSACAACCSIGAILSTVLAVPTPTLTPTVFSAAVVTIAPFVAGGPDRPPRAVPV